MKIVEQILLCESSTDSYRLTKELQDSNTLHVLATQYNWDYGFDIPNRIIENQYCDLGTAILLFYLADGYRFLEDQNISLSQFNQAWYDFVSKLYERICSCDFAFDNIKSIPPISKLQALKLKKLNSQIPSVLLETKDGIEIDTQL